MAVRWDGTPGSANLHALAEFLHKHVTSGELRRRLHPDDSTFPEGKGTRQPRPGACG
jgi:hypothetical protein